MDETQARGRRRVMGRVAAVAAATTAAALLTTGIVGGQRSASAQGLEEFGDCSALGDWYREAMEPLVGPWGYGGGPMIADTVGGTLRATGAESGADAAVDAMGTEAAGSGAVGNGATGTNVQEAGVDEPDVVKTADDLLYTTVGPELVVVDVSSDEPRQLGSVTVPALAARWGGDGNSGGPAAPAPDLQVGPSAELLLVGSSVVVLSSGFTALPDQPTGQGMSRSVMPYPAGQSLTGVTVVDVSDPTEPAVRSTLEVEGSYVSARESSGAVRLVVSTTPVLPWVQPETAADGTFDEDAATERNLQVLREADPLVFVPHVVQRSASGEVAARRPLLACDAVSHPAEHSGAGTVSVLTLDVDASEPLVDTDAVTADGDLVYASTDRLYVATTQGGWTWFREGAAPENPSTALHGFDIGSASATSYLASGEVEGWLLGRWALSARDGYLRVATTRGQPWAGDPAGAPQTDSAVTVLAESGDALTPVGSVDGLGKGEQIRAVRWFDDVAVVVTFRQTDPLYVVDLADPAAPAVRGELKIPGYSAYLHPLGDSLLLGIGQDADDQGRTTGTQVSTFDLRDPAAPSQVDVLVEKNTWSEVEGDSRTFSYLPDRRVALVPMSGDHGASVRAISVAGDGSLAEVGAFAPKGSPDWTSWLVRSMPVDADRVAALSQGEGGMVLTLLELNSLSPTGSTTLR